MDLGIVKNGVERHEKMDIGENHREEVQEEVQEEVKKNNNDNFL